jgi:hypothetical protein
MLIDGVIDAEIIARQLGLSLDQLALAAAQLEANPRSHYRSRRRVAVFVCPVSRLSNLGRKLVP